MNPRPSNADIEIIPLHNLDAERWNLFRASGNTADHISLNGDRKNLIDQAIMRPIEADMIRADMPQWLAKVAELIGSEEVMWEQTPYADGLIYQAPFSHAPVMESGAMFIRGDWLVLHQAGKRAIWRTVALRRGDVLSRNSYGYASFARPAPVRACLAELTLF